MKKTKILIALLAVILSFTATLTVSADYADEGSPAEVAEAESATTDGGDISGDESYPADGADGADYADESSPAEVADGADYADEGYPAEVAEAESATTEGGDISGDDASLAPGDSEKSKADTTADGIEADENEAAASLTTEGGENKADEGESGEKDVDEALITEGNSQDTDGGENVPENPFATLLRQIGEYATEILCSISLVGSLILAYAYRKGLLPLIKNALSAIAEAVGRLKEGGEATARETEAKLGKINELISSECERLRLLDERLGELFEGLRCVESKFGDTESVRAVIAEQVELLYDVFMSSSLPQYKKDSVGERIAKMRKELSSNEEG